MAALPLPLRKPLSWLADMMIPPRCAGCGCRIAQPDQFCGRCFAAAERLIPPLCHSCGQPIAADDGADGQNCAACLADAPPFDWARAPYRYGGVIRSSILGVKNGRLLACRTLARQMVSVLPAGFEAAVLLPIPLHATRLRQRRYNQSALLAAELGRYLGLSVEADLLQRRKATESQAGKSRAARRRNLSGAFTLKQGAKSVLKDKKLVLIDDVMTTGATVRAAASTLRRANPAAIGVLTVARVLRGDLGATAGSHHHRY